MRRKGALAARSPRCNVVACQSVNEPTKEDGVTRSVVVMATCLLVAVLPFGDSYPQRAASAQTADRAAPERPNIVLVLTDDMRYDELLRIEGFRKTLVDQGTTFTRAYATNPLCCPTRVTLLTGRYSTNHGERTNIEPQGGGRRFPGWASGAPRWPLGSTPRATILPSSASS